MGFALFYTLLYRRIVRFDVPAWLVLRAKAPAEQAARVAVGEEADARQ